MPKFKQSSSGEGSLVMKSKIGVERVFTKEINSAFDSVNWVKRDSIIYNTDGSVNFVQRDIEVPEFWDQISVDILASNYLRKRGVPQ